MAKDVIVVVNIDAKPKASEALDILILSTAGAKDIKTYRSLEEVAADFPNSGDTEKTYRKVAALFNQGKTTLAETLIRKVKVGGIAAPTGSDAAAKAKALVEAVETIRETDNDWYILLTDQDGDDAVKALCAWAEGTEPTEAELGAGEEDHRKFYFGQTSNKSLAVTNRRCALICTDSAKLDEEADAAYVGNVGPFYPQSVTWKFKRPQGISLPNFTNAQRDALEEANINFLTDEYKKIYVKNGVCCDGEFIDVQMGADYIAQYMREELYSIFLNNASSPPASSRPSTAPPTSASLPPTRRAMQASLPSPSPSGPMRPTTRPGPARCLTSCGKRNSRGLSTASRSRARSAPHSARNR